MFGLVILIILVIIAYIAYKKHIKSVRSSSNIDDEYDHAIIIGGSIGGMVTAAYLSKYFKRITIIESDDVLNDKLMKSTLDELLNYRCNLASPTSLGRCGVPQIYQLHVIEGEGYKILGEILPDFENKLFSEYGIRSYSLKNEGRFVVNGFLINQDFIDLKWLGLDRFSLETILRREINLKFKNKIQWKCNSKVMQLIVDQSLNIVKGVKYRCKQNNDSSLFDIYGDFIIDCSGRNSSSIKWLKQSFNLNVPTEEINLGIGYVTFVGERFRIGDPSFDSKPIVCTTANAPYKNVGCYITPIRQIKTTDQNSLGILSTIVVHCVNFEYPPNDSYENLLDWVKEHVDSEYYSILKSTKVYSPLVPYHRGVDYRKYTELLGNKWPHNFILLGDAMCTFNPQLGQGMTHACRQARVLNQIFKENFYQLKDISHIFNSRASKISEECWLISTSNDWNTPTLKVTRTAINGQIKTYHRDISTKNFQIQPSLMIQFFQWYSYWFLKCASKSGQLATDYLLVVNQHQSPFILLKPITFLTVLYTAIIYFK
jgi:2-polyprenyl-6-methoxyphenol hydroxylase-like FAD-dependent oxidoreductase